MHSLKNTVDVNNMAINSFMQCNFDVNIKTIMYKDSITVINVFYFYILFTNTDINYSFPMIDIKFDINQSIDTSSQNKSLDTPAI